MSVHLPPGVNPNDIPAGTPPPGQHSNLIDPPKLQSTNLGVNILLMVIGVTLASLSLFDHRRRLQIPDCEYFGQTNVIGNSITSNC